MTDRAFRRTLTAWADEYRAENPDLDEAIACATYDLYFGPGADPESMGFETALGIIKAAMQEVPSTLYVDVDAEIVTEDEEDASEYTYTADLRDIKRALFGKELAPYV
jgi:hypothetical protein